MTPNEALTLEQIQLGHPVFWSLPTPEREGAFQTLRRERPVSFHEEVDVGFIPPGPGFWAVTKHADILEISRNPEVFCSGKGAATIADLPTDFLELFGSMINMDDPKHRRLRKLVSAGFTKRQLTKIEGYVEETAKDVLDRVLAKGTRECDFVTDISAPFPIRIICDMMGIPESQHAFVFEKTNVILGGGDPEYVPPGENLVAAIYQAGQDLYALMDDLRKVRKENPTDDLTSILVHAEIDGERLTDQEIGSFFILLVNAGNETTRNAISHGMKALHDNPDEKRAWAEDFEALTFTAVEEIVRWASPVIFMRRTATRDTVVGEQPLREGEKVLLFYNSGNRDEDVFPEPFRFDIRRDPNDHVAFGGPGTHFCLGANLAKREIEVMFREIFRRLPGLEVTGEPERLNSPFIHGIKHLPCRF